MADAALPQARLPRSKACGPVLTHLVDGKECVTVVEAARILGCSRQAVWMRVQRKTLPSVRIGDQIFVPLDAVAAPISRPARRINSEDMAKSRHRLGRGEQRDNTNITESQARLILTGQTWAR